MAELWRCSTLSLSSFLVDFIEIWISLFLFLCADMECIFTVISNLVSKAQSPDDALAMADQIANKLTAQPIEKPAIRLKMYAIVHRLKGMC